MDEESKLSRRSGRSGIGQAFHGANLALAFLPELCALAALGYWGFPTGSGVVTRIGPDVGAPLLAAVLWGLFASPRVPVSVPLVEDGVQAAFFGSTAAALYASSRIGLAVSSSYWSSTTASWCASDAG